ncbi:MAG TPA: ATP-binding cassette domain-containing protein [Gammaproteobacteria bacterium]|nr:ATP-binding cassette domain-containing protein [Gammaproteobacteria bacterium]
MNEDNIIEMRRVGTRFGNRIIHQNVNLDVKKGEILGIVGGSGSGKTTLMREMIGLERPTEGEIAAFGSPLDAGTRLRDRAGVLFQSGALFTALTVYDNIALPLRELKLLDEELIHELVCMKLSMVGLEAHAAYLLPAALSGGMVKRVALARALALEPELLFLDEPTSGLDPIASEAFTRLVANLHKELRFTVVLITHDLNTVKDLCHRVAVLADRRVVAVGPVDEVVESRHPFVRRFFQGEYARRILQA